MKAPKIYPLTLLIFLKKKMNEIIRTNFPAIPQIELAQLNYLSSWKRYKWIMGFNWNNPWIMWTWFMRLIRLNNWLLANLKHLCTLKNPFKKGILFFSCLETFMPIKKENYFQLTKCRWWDSPYLFVYIKKKFNIGNDIHTITLIWSYKLFRCLNFNFLTNSEFF